MRLNKKNQDRKIVQIMQRRRPVTKQEAELQILQDMVTLGLCPPLTATHSKIQQALREGTESKEGIEEVLQCMRELNRGAPKTGPVECSLPDYMFKDPSEYHFSYEEPRSFAIPNSWAKMVDVHLLPNHLRWIITDHVMDITNTLFGFIHLRQWCYAAWYPNASPEAIDQSKKLGDLGLLFGLSELRFQSLFQLDQPIGKLAPLRYARHP